MSETLSTWNGIGMNLHLHQNDLSAYDETASPLCKCYMHAATPIYHHIHYIKHTLIYVGDAIVSQ